MNTLQHALAQPRALWLLAVLPALGILTFLAARRRRRALAHSGPSSRSQSSAWEGPKWRRSWRSYFAWIALTCLALGIAGPRWGRDWDQSLAPGRDLVIVVDLSLSMLARDV